MDTVIYAYPMVNVVSFTHIARNHIRYLKRYIRITEVDVDSFDISHWSDKHKMFVHPICYPFMKTEGDSELRATKFIDLAKKKRYTLVGFDVADSDLFSEFACRLMSSYDLVVFPSTFARNVYIRSCEYYGITPTNAIVLPHGISEEFSKPVSITDPYFRSLLDLKRNMGLTFVLFNLWHSAFRKGADLFVEAMRIVQAKYPNVVILLKTGDHEDIYTKKVKKLRHIHVKGMLPIDKYVQLFDVSDIVVLTSRGGGFEHNALEAIARGKPTIVPNAGCFLDYAKYAITVSVTDKKPKIFKDNPIHIGKGWEIDTTELARTIIDVVEHYNEYRDRFIEYAKIVRNEYSWSNIIDYFAYVLSRYKIVNVKASKPKILYAYHSSERHS